METFLSKFPNAINGSISCFDRVVFKGHLPICWGKRFMGFLYSKGVLFKNADKYSKQQGQAIADSMETWAKKRNRPSVYVKSSRERKDDIVRQVLADNPADRGLVCVIRAVESCCSFRLCYGKDRLWLKNAMRKCLCCFTHISDYAKAQELADRFVKLKWVSKLNAFARRVNPLLKTELKRMEYYWCASAIKSMKCSRSASARKMAFRSIPRVTT